MLLSALSFTGRALYLTTQYYKGRPTEILLREYVKAEAIKYRRAFKSVFIIATNETDAKKLTAEQLLEVYKSQGTSVERGFRFLKDPMFYAESLYLKSPKWIMALLMVMGLSLLVYAPAGRKLRSA